MKWTFTIQMHFGIKNYNFRSGSMNRGEGLKFCKIYQKTTNIWIKGENGGKGETFQNESYLINNWENKGFF